jgi:hypothetical protein
MRVLQCFVILLAVQVLLPDSSQGQPLNYLRVPPYTVNNIYLSDFIMGDTLPNGTRRDPNVVYVLQRGGLYYSSAVIQTQSTWPLRITANDSTTTRLPRIFLAGTTPPGNFANLRSSLSLKSVILAGYDELVPANFANLQGGLINTAVQGVDIVIDSCILKSVNGNLIRTDNAPRVVKVTNTTFGDMGYLGTSNLGAGKAIDLRAGSCDSLVLLNNTFVNYQDRIVRHFASTLNIQFIRFEHNTLVNGMSYHGMLSLGRVGRRVIIRDNLLIDAFALGNDSDAVRQAEFTDSGELDQWGFPRMSWVIANPNDTTSWLIKNNYYYISPAGQVFWDSASILPIVANPPLTPGSPLTHKINSRIGADSVTAFRLANVTLSNIPNLMVNFMKWYRKPYASGGAGKTKLKDTWASSQYDYDRRGYIYYRDTLNCAYSTSNALYTAATCGYPVGDLRWFPTRHASWLVDPCVQQALPVNENPVLPTAFELAQNYPNPFNPTTRITYSVPTQSRVVLEVVNVLGQRVETLVNDVQPAGQHEVTFDASRLATGMYLYRLTSPSQTITRKMMLVK